MRSGIPPVDGVVPSDTDAERQLEAYIAVELGTNASEQARKHAKAALDLAVALEHKRSATWRDPAMCLEATAMKSGWLRSWRGGVTQDERSLSGYAKPSAARMTVPAFPLTRILIITDAWLPQVNGVVRSIEVLVREAPALGVEIEILAADGFRTVPLPTYPQLRVAVTRPGAVRRRIEELKPDFIHIATEGPLGLCAWLACRRAGRPFTTCYHTRFPEYLAARRVAPSRVVYALLRRFHNAGSGMMVSTETLGRELDTRGFVRLMRWSRGVDCNLFRPRAACIFEFPRPIFPTCSRVAVEKNLDAFLSLDLPGSKVVIGDGPARRKLQTRFPRAHFVGEMRDERLAAAYASAEVFVFPSLTDTFGLVLLEALASGLPVAANPVVGQLT